MAGQALSILFAGNAGDQIRSRLTSLTSDTQFRRLACVFAVSLAAAALLNPHGPGLFLSSWRLSNHPNIRFIEEWKPIPIKSLAGYSFLASVLLLMVALRWSPLRWTPFQVILLLGFGWQALAHVRVLIWWAMVVVWILIPHLQAVARLCMPVAIDLTRRADLRKTLLAGLTGIALLLWSAPAQWLFWNEAPSGAKRVTTDTPIQASQYLREEYAKDAKRAAPRYQRTVFTSETMGDYLLWDLRLDPPVFVTCYTHVHLLTPEHWRDCFTVKSGSHGWQEALDRMGAQFVVFEPGLHPNLTAQLTAAKDRWQVVTSEPVLVARRK